MSEHTYLMPPTLPAQDAPPDPMRTLDTLATVLVVILSIGVLYFAREILVPVAIAVLLSFVMSPLVKGLRKLGLGKKISVGLVVCAAFVIAIGIGAILAKQISDLAADAPRFQSTIARKVETVRNFSTANPLLNKLNSVIAEVSQPTKPVKTKPSPEAASPAPKPADEANPLLPGPRTGPVAVEIISPPPGVLTLLQAAIGMAASPVATAAFVALFIVFILMQREDLRNRFIRLAGSSDLQRTTLAMTDAARRLSRYFLAQVLLNTAFGAVAAGALTVLGVPSAPLWGIVAIFMRFIPYIGAVGAAMFPVLLAAAADPGWSLAIEAALFFVVLEVIVGQVVEPLVYGHHTGISPIAVVLSATFWTWLWGPVGLVLSTPMTVCLVVMGRHVSRLKFLDVLLGDAPALSQVEMFYQRMLAGDPSEILDHADRFLSERSLLDYSDHIAMKALLIAQVDVRRGALEDVRQSRIRDTMRDLAEDLADRDDGRTASGSDSDASSATAARGAGRTDDLGADAIDAAWGRPKAVVCFAGRTPLDEAAAHLLADLLHERGIGAHVEPAESLMRKDVTVDPGETQLVILSFLDADLSVAQAKVTVRRLRRRTADVPLLAAFWMAESDEERVAALCNNVRCDACASSLPQAIRICLERAGRPIEIAEAA